jgi:hypothetical protein
MPSNRVINGALLTGFLRIYIYTLVEKKGKFERIRDKVIRMMVRLFLLRDFKIFKEKEKFSLVFYHSIQYSYWQYSYIQKYMQSVQCWNFRTNKGGQGTE